MSIKSDIVVVGVAAVVLLAAGWYVKTKVAGAVTGAVTAAGDFLTGPVRPVEGPVRDAIGGMVFFMDDQINALGRLLTGNPNADWASWGPVKVNNHQFEPDFGILNPSEGW